MKEVKVLNTEVSVLFEKDFNSFDFSKKLRVAKINSEFLLRALKNDDFQKTLNEFDIKIADGVGVLWAAKYLSLPASKNKLMRFFQAIFQMIYSGASLVFYPKYCHSPIPNSFPGLDCFKLMLKNAQGQGKSVYFFGARKEILLSAVEKIRAEFPDLKIAGFQDGYSNKGKGVIESINKSEAEILFVALGSPEQEYWIRDNLTKLPNIKMAVGEGGTFDYIAGASKRAPKFFNKIGLEWCWRLFRSPNMTTGAGSRIKRVWRAVPVFIIETVKWKITHSISARGGGENA